jgi:hypothetical protein
MEAEAAKFIGAGLATAGHDRRRLGVGNIFGTSSKARCATRPTPARQIGNLSWAPRW